MRIAVVLPLVNRYFPGQQDNRHPLVNRLVPQFPSLPGSPKLGLPRPAPGVPAREKAGEAADRAVTVLQVRDLHSAAVL